VLRAALCRDQPVIGLVGNPIDGDRYLDVVIATGTLKDNRAPGWDSHPRPRPVYPGGLHLAARLGDSNIYIICQELPLASEEGDRDLRCDGEGVLLHVHPYL